MVNLYIKDDNLNRTWGLQIPKMKVRYWFLQFRISYPVADFEERKCPGFLIIVAIILFSGLICELNIPNTCFNVLRSSSDDVTSIRF